MLSGLRSSAVIVVLPGTILCHGHPAVSVDTVISTQVSAVAPVISGSGPLRGSTSATILCTNHSTV